ncbi:hypothetical protein [Kitasatospora sp. NPDC057015]|uniref:hypothetical protein n=1 Tax=Kitasatospora sp. NPDC057015 TaxID=3346001 RepID=UPI00363FB210
MSVPWLEMSLTFRDDDGPESTERDMEFLLEELAGLPLDVAPAGAGPAPAGTRTGDLTAYASLAVGLLGGAAGVRALISVLGDWLSRRNSGEIELTAGGHRLRMTSVSRADQHKAIDAFIAAVNSPASPEPVLRGSGPVPATTSEPASVPSPVPEPDHGPTTPVAQETRAPASPAEPSAPVDASPAGAADTPTGEALDG